LPERRDDHRRLFLEPEPEVAQTAPVQGQVRAYDRSDPAIRIPMADYAETGKSRKPLAIGLLLVLVVGGIAGGTYVWRGDGPAYLKKFEATVRRAFNRDAGSGASSGDAARENVGSGVDSSPVASGNAEGASRSDGVRGANEVAEAVTPAPEVRGAAGVGAATRERMNRGANSSLAEASGRGGFVQVPAEVMQARLISSRVPVYPEEARADHVEGRVVMQAIVTKDGGVGHLHVVSGNSLLRAAAMEAVSAWRYRPYVMNGEPVDVLTTVSVDFLVDK
jgi:TonB family protein